MTTRTTITGALSDAVRGRDVCILASTGGEAAALFRDAVRILAPFGLITGADGWVLRIGLRNGARIAVLCGDGDVT